jgi:hypothetical protein
MFRPFPVDMYAGQVMKNCFRGLLFLLAVFPLRASPIEATFVGVNGALGFGYYVGPYYGRLDQQSVVLDCVDFANDVSFGQHWAANLSHINTQGDLGNTRFGGRTDALQLYQEAAWLTIQYSLNPASAYADIQATIWQLFDTYAPNPSTGYWLSQAEANYTSAAYDNFFVVTNVGPVNPTGQVQEFLTVLQPGMPVYPQSVAQNMNPTYTTLATPEPPLVGALGLILICLGVLRKRVRKL